MYIAQTWKKKLLFYFSQIKMLLPQPNHYQQPKTNKATFVGFVLLLVRKSTTTPQVSILFKSIQGNLARFIQVKIK
jgi:hypothetical protein